jgi:hypothetical protein
MPNPLYVSHHSEEFTSSSRHGVTGIYVCRSPNELWSGQQSGDLGIGTTGVACLCGFGPGGRYPLDLGLVRHRGAGRLNRPGAHPGQVAQVMPRLSESVLRRPRRPGSPESCAANLGHQRGGPNRPLRRRRSTRPSARELQTPVRQGTCSSGRPDSRGSAGQPQRCRSPRGPGHAMTSSAAASGDPSGSDAPLRRVRSGVVSGDGLGLKTVREWDPNADGASLGDHLLALGALDLKAPVGALVQERGVGDPGLRARHGDCDPNGLSVRCEMAYPQVGGPGFLCAGSPKNVQAGVTGQSRGEPPCTFIRPTHKSAALHINPAGGPAPPPSPKRGRRTRSAVADRA